MTEEFSRRLRLKPVSHEGDVGGGVSTVGKEVTPLEPEPDTSSRKGMASCAESASVSASGTSKRMRTQRVLTNVSALGEIHSVDVDGALSFCDDVDSIFMTDGAQYYREPETYQESLDCAEHHEWRAARAAERRALQDRVLRVVPTPTGVRPIKSRYVYKRK